MKKYLVIYSSSVPARDQMTNATEGKAVMEAWMAWSRKAGSAIVDLGSPLGNAASITGAKAGDATSPIGGFSILQGDSRDAIVALMRQHPHLTMPGATIEVHEFMPIPGM
jgi:hypothetical protein